MNDTKKIIIAVVAVVVIVAGAAVAGKLLSDDTSNGTTNTPTTGDNSGSIEISEDEVAATITYKDGAFSPASVTVPSGSAVRIVNESDEDVAPSSNNHPEHTENSEVNFPDIAPGQTATMVVTEKGTWGMHNHFDEDEHLTIIVE